MFASNTVFIVGDAKTQQHNPITAQYGQFFIAFVVRPDSGEIVECGCSATLEITNRFIQSIFWGKSLETDSQAIRTEVESRYFGSSQKAIIAAFKDAQKKYLQYKNGQSVEL